MLLEVPWLSKIEALLRFVVVAKLFVFTCLPVGPGYAGEGLQKSVT